MAIVILILPGVAVAWRGEVYPQVRRLVATHLDIRGLDPPQLTPEDLEMEPEVSDYLYVLSGKPDQIWFDAYSGVNDYFSTKHPASFDDEHDYWLPFIDESAQDRYLTRLARNTGVAETDPDDLMRAVTSMAEWNRMQDRGQKLDQCTDRRYWNLTRWWDAVLERDRLVA